MSYTREEILVWPKVELHVHLDCSITYPAISEILPGQYSYEQYREYFTAPAKCSDLGEYLSYVHHALEILQDEHALRTTMNFLLEAQATENVIYTEIRMAPLLHTKKDLTAEKVCEIVCESFQDGLEKYRMKGALIFCTLRHFTEFQSLHSAELAIAFKDKGVAGFDIAGDEARWPLDPHVKAFEMVSEAGICTTAHAGEALGPESILETLHKLKTNRLGHGVQAIKDPELINTLTHRHIHLEICPTSNIQTNVFPDLKQHALDDLKNAGISISINTDGRALSAVDLTTEYMHTIEAFKWSKQDFYQTNLNAIQAAFCPDNVKATLMKNLLRGF